MITFYNTMGKISMTTSFFSELVATAVQSGYGVAGMATKGAADSIRSFINKDHPEKGVRVTEQDDGLVIELHIMVTYGLNIAQAVKSITHKIKYVVQEATGLEVKSIHVSVDDIVG